MILSLIAAVTENNVIGQGGAMPWHLPEDLKYFKATTLGHTVIMGRKTWESLGKYAPLPNRRNIVLMRKNLTAALKGIAITDRRDETKTLTVSPPANTEVFPNLPFALAACKDETEAFIIGGGQIYAEAMPLANRLYITRIHATIEGDTFFPDIPQDFKLIKSTPGSTADPKLTFEILER